ncbi:MAG: hypothetical protein P8L38_00740 [Gammaproteobacteria bacterium]|jgi:hypothetical protein|nr:hypothetical protein [Gammaproteobacteria bacterium]
MYTVLMLRNDYPNLSFDEDINLWNKNLKQRDIFPIELIIDKKNKNFSNLKKIFNTLSLDKIKPDDFINVYLDAKRESDINYFILKMTNLFISHKVNKSLSEGQSIKSARTQTVARILCLSFSDPKLSSESNFKNLKKVVRECTKDIRM